MEEIAVIDYGMGNLRSVAKALEHVAPRQCRIRVTSDPDVVRRCARVVFPGQGAAGDCMQALGATGLADAIREVVHTRPFLGICMGMQVLVGHSEENQGTACLGIFPGEVRYFGDAFERHAQGQHLKIPHMGWNRIHQLHPHPLWTGVAQDSYFYFVHSYYVDPAQPEVVAGVTEYGIEFCSVIATGNVFAMQCHPEKSAGTGLRLLENFCRWEGTESA